MALRDHGKHGVIGSHLAVQLVAENVDQVVAGEHACGDFPMHQMLFGQERQGDLDQRHVMMPSLPASLSHLHCISQKGCYGVRNICCQHR